MKPEQHAREEGFYKGCARLLDVVHTLQSPDREAAEPLEQLLPGNGRFPSFGTIHLYVPYHIDVSLRQPVTLNRICRSVGEVYDLLRKLRLKLLSKKKARREAGLKFGG